MDEPCTARLVTADGSVLSEGQITEQDSADLQGDLDRVSRSEPPSLRALLGLLYEASSNPDRSLVPAALDRLLDYVDHWSAVAPEPISSLFEQLDPSRLVRAVGQTLLASTRLASPPSPARQAFLSRFIEDLRARNTPEATIRRIQRGLDA